MFWQKEEKEDNFLREEYEDFQKELAEKYSVQVEACYLNNRKDIEGFEQCLQQVNDKIEKIN